MNRLLLVDDDVELRAMLADYLAPEGFEGEAVHDGDEGVKRAVNGGFDVVVLDVLLPRLSGTEILRRIRRDSQVPVLMLTAKGDDVDRIVGLELGADDYLPKPCNPRELVARLRDVTSTEFNLLEVLIGNAGRVVSKAELSERALGRPLTRYDRSVDMHVTNLRKKLSPLADGRSPIQTVRGVGYQFVKG
jgi:two-component system OmpR family response regulator